MKNTVKASCIAGFVLLATFVVVGPAAAESNQMWCEFSGGTWKGAMDSDGGTSNSRGVCIFELVAAPDRAKVACMNVGGTIDATKKCAVGNENFAKVKASADFRASIARKR